MKIEAFQSERLLSIWQNQVEYDFTETGVHPMYLHELVTPAEFDELYQTVQLRYIQTNGTLDLKDAICQLYPDAVPENVLVTNGSAEANFITLWKHVNPGDEVVVLYPNYMQVSDIARNLQIISDWLESYPGLFRFVPPKIGGVAFVGYSLPINSTELVMKLLREHSVLLVPGDAFGLDGYLRIGYGAHNLKPGLELVNKTLQTLDSQKR